jgi:predicted dehydrogenase
MSTPHRAQRIRVGIIGANPDRGWAAQAHIPALTSLSVDFASVRAFRPRLSRGNAVLSHF